MTAQSSDIPLPYRIVALMQERNRLFAHPLERLAIELWGTRFRCTCCGKCCTREVNRNIFLLDHDVAAARTIDPAAFEPAPDPEFCDQHGVLYVSGYVLKMHDDDCGSCWFLSNKNAGFMKRGFPVAVFIPTCSAAAPKQRIRLSGTGSHTKASTGGTTRHFPWKNAW